MRCGLLGVARRSVATRSSNVVLVSSISAHSSPGQRPSIARRASLVEAVEPSPSASASRLAGSMVTTHGAPARAARPRGEHGGGGGLADAAGAAAHDDRGSTASTSSRRRSSRSRRQSVERADARRAARRRARSSSAGAEVGREQVRAAAAGAAGSALGEPVELLVLQRRAVGGGSRPPSPSASRLAGVAASTPAASAAAVGSASMPASSG